MTNLINQFLVVKPEKSKALILNTTIGHDAEHSVCISDLAYPSSVSGPS
jgi:hypothetical protein